MSQIEVTPEELTETKEQTKKSHVLVLLNDNHNTFGYVIHLLMVICEHTKLQAEQCANIVHFKGKCEVKYGEYEDLNRMRRKLVEHGLRAKVITV